MLVEDLVEARDAAPDVAAVGLRGAGDGIDALGGERTQTLGRKARPRLWTRGAGPGMSRVRNAEDRMLKPALCGCLALALAVAGASSARADGWSVTTKPAKGVCLAGREGVNKATNKKTTLVFGIYKDADEINLVLTLTSQDWNYDKEQPVEADILLLGVDGTTLSLRSRWIGDGHSLASTFDKAGSLLNAFGQSPAFTLQTEPNKGITFDTPNAKGALDSAKACLVAK
jgi:hypothetical protein